MKRGGRYYIVDGKRVPESEYKREYEKARQEPNKQSEDSGKTNTKTQRGKQS